MLFHLHIRKFVAFFPPRRNIQHKSQFDKYIDKYIVILSTGFKTKKGLSEVVN